MSDEVFKAALELAMEFEDMEITLGGGEPTLHPRFWEFLGLALKAHALLDDGLEWKPLVITNGSVTDSALALARLSKAGVISAELSQDEWHDPIDPRVIREFGQRIRQVRNIRRVGRGRMISGSTPGCCCETMLIDPEGVIWSCGCKQVRWGTVFAPDIPEDRLDAQGDYECGQDRIKRLRKLEKTA